MKSIVVRLYRVESHNLFTFAFFLSKSEKKHHPGLSYQFQFHNSLFRRHQPQGAVKIAEGQLGLGLSFSLLLLLLLQLLQLLLVQCCIKEVKYLVEDIFPLTLFIITLLLQFLDL